MESLEKDRWNFKKIHGTHSFSYNRWFITEAPRQNIKELVLSSQKNKVSSSQFSQNWAIHNLLKFNSAPSFMCLLDQYSLSFSWAWCSSRTIRFPNIPVIVTSSWIFSFQKSWPSLCFVCKTFTTWSSKKPQGKLWEQNLLLEKQVIILL